MFGVISTWQHITSALKTSSYGTLVTFLVGLVALYVYQKQRIDRKKDAANIILLEIKNAEAHLTVARDAVLNEHYLPDAIFTMRTSNWEKYGYLFARDFTAEEWNMINTFYEKCYLYDQAVLNEGKYYQEKFNQTRSGLNAALSTYIQSYLNDVYSATHDHRSALHAFAGLPSQQAHARFNRWYQLRGAVRR